MPRNRPRTAWPRRAAGASPTTTGGKRLEGDEGRPAAVGSSHDSMSEVRPAGREGQIGEVLAAMAEGGHNTFQALTKNPAPAKVADRCLATCGARSERAGLLS